MTFKFNMPDVEYHQHSALSSSGLRLVNNCPLKYWNQKLNPERGPETRTPAMTFGSAFHYAVLEPELYDKRVVIAPEINRRTNAGKEEWKAFTEEHANKEIITSEQAKEISLMKDAVHKHEAAFGLISRMSNVEASAFAVLNGVECKARFDGLIMQEDVILDLKTTESASPKGFRGSVFKYGYHVQDAFYCSVYEAITGRPVRAFIFIAVEKKPPFAVGCYVLGHDLRQEGQRIVQEGIASYEQCQRTQHWPSYNNDQIMEI